MENLINLEKKINSELTTKINSSKVKHNQIYLSIDSKDIIDVILFMKTNKNSKFRQLIDVTAVDYPEKEQRFRIVYLLLSHEFNTRVLIEFDISEGENRGQHAHIECHQVLIACFGSFQVLLDDGKTKKKVFLNKPYLGLHIPPGIWATETNFSKGSVCLVLASHKFDEKDYIRNYNDFIKFD